ncbi:MAG: LysE family transporter [Alphaproteobacteria bacterium]|jgi:putative LysE/RhtB family amino acid efflux pump|nr:LysE family transporter [Alphaproteobacteria bacterium]MDP6812379.1 LysE family transporter [Alphaproteobacteria bacterium]
MMLLFLQGMALGLAIAAPVGPIGLLCIRRSLHSGFALGFATGLGAALADGSYGAVAGFGLTAVSGALMAAEMPLRLLGGGFLIYLAARGWRRRVDGQGGDGGRPGLLLAVGGTYLLTLANPTTILSFLAIFTSLGIGRAAGDVAAALSLVVGVFLGSALWWLLLAGGVTVMRHRLPSRALDWINRLSALIILAFGLRAIAGALW